MTVYESNTEVPPTGEEAAESEDRDAEEYAVRVAPDPDDPRGPMSLVVSRRYCGLHRLL